MELPAPSIGFPNRAAESLAFLAAWREEMSSLCAHKFRGRARFILYTILVFPIVASGDNDLLEELANEDQSARSGETIGSGEAIRRTDKERRMLVFSLLAAGKVNTPVDKMHAGIILLHTGLRQQNDKFISKSVENYFLAHELFKQAFESGLEKAAPFVAYSIDRYLGHTKGCQKYGTQRVRNTVTDEWELYPIDRSVSDSERAKYDIPPLRELLSKYPERKNSADSDAPDISCN